MTKQRFLLSKCSSRVYLKLIEVKCSTSQRVNKKP